MKVKHAIALLERFGPVSRSAMPNSGWKYEVAIKQGSVYFFEHNKGYVVGCFSKRHDDGSSSWFELVHEAIKHSLDERIRRYLMAGDEQWEVTIYLFHDVRSLNPSSIMLFLNQVDVGLWDDDPQVQSMGLDAAQTGQLEPLLDYVLEKYDEIIRKEC